MDTLDMLKINTQDMLKIRTLDILEINSLDIVNKLYNIYIYIQSTHLQFTPGRCSCVPDGLAHFLIIADDGVRGINAGACPARRSGSLRLLLKELRETSLLQRKIALRLQKWPRSGRLGSLPKRPEFLLRQQCRPSWAWSDR